MKDIRHKVKDISMSQVDFHSTHLILEKWGPS